MRSELASIVRHQDKYLVVINGEKAAWFYTLDEAFDYVRQHMEKDNGNDTTSSASH